MCGRGRGRSIKVRYCIYWENMAFIPSYVPKLPLSMEPSRGKMMKKLVTIPHRTRERRRGVIQKLGFIAGLVWDHAQHRTHFGVGSRVGIPGLGCLRYYRPTISLKITK